MVEYTNMLYCCTLVLSLALSLVLSLALSLVLSLALSLVLSLALSLVLSLALSLVFFLALQPPSTCPQTWSATHAVSAPTAVLPPPRSGAGTLRASTSATLVGSTTASTEPTGMEDRKRR